MAAVQHTTLIVEAPDLQSARNIDGLFGPRCGGAAVGRTHGIQHVDFDLEGPSAVEAITSAVPALEQTVAARSFGSWTPIPPPWPNSLGVLPAPPGVPTSTKRNLVSVSTGSNAGPEPSSQGTLPNPLPHFYSL